MSMNKTKDEMAFKESTGFRSECLIGWKPERSSRPLLSLDFTFGCHSALPIKLITKYVFSEFNLYS